MRTILYVEDNLDHAELVLRCWERANLRERIVHLADGEQAISYLRQCNQSGPRPQIVVLDLRLPKADGFEVLQEIRGSQNLANIPVIILTTSAQESDIQRAYLHHANSYLVKPESFELLSHLIEDLSRYWLTWNLVSLARA